MRVSEWRHWPATCSTPARLARSMDALGGPSGTGKNATASSAALIAFMTFPHFSAAAPARAISSSWAALAAPLTPIAPTT